MSAIESIYDYFEDHSKATAYANQSRPVIFGMFCFALGGVSLFVAKAMAHKLFVLPFTFSSLFLTMLWEVVAGFLTAAVLHLILDIEGIEGSAVSLFVLLGMANLVWAVAIPFVMLLRLIMPESVWPVTLVFFIVGLMVFTLKARSLKDNYRISGVRAWVTLGLPYLALFVAAMVALSLALWIFILKFVQLVG